RQVADALLDGEAGLAQRFAQPGRRLLLLETQFRLGVDSMAERDHGVAGGLEAFARPGFCIHDRVPRCCDCKRESNTATANMYVVTARPQIEALMRQRVGLARARCNHEAIDQRLPRLSDRLPVRLRSAGDRRG